MAFSLGKLIYVCVLWINAIAVLSEDRFLARIGWSTSTPDGWQLDQNTVKYRMISLIQAVRTLLRIPLVVVNVLIIIYEIIAG